MDSREVFLKSMAKAIALEVREAGFVPASSIFLALGSDLADFRAVLEILKLGGMIEESGQLLRWIGPAKPREAPCGCPMYERTRGEWVVGHVFGKCRQ